MPTPSDDMQTVVFEFNGKTLECKQKFPVFKFMRLVFDNPVAAFDLALTEESIETLDNMDMNFDDFSALVDKMTAALGIKDSKN